MPFWKIKRNLKIFFKLLDSPLTGTIIVAFKEMKMLKIGEFSCLAKTTVKTLRYYDEIGLLKPVFVDDNGYRYYQIDQLNDLLKIVELRKLDVPVLTIKEVLNSNNVSEILTKQLSYLENELKRKHEQISLIKNYIAKAEKGEFMEKYVAKEIVVPESKVYYRHGEIKSMADILNFVLQAGKECAKNNPTMKCTGYCYVTYTAKEYKEKDVELEYVEAVENFGKESENIKFRIDPKISAISVQNKGPYRDLQKAYAFALNYVKENDFEIAGPIREVYIHGCWDTENEADFLTEIQIPINK